MDIEELSKAQIVLLTLLVSFVTSIATGIVTVSLMAQAPPAIAQTVNRIIERTVEKMAPQGQAAATVVTQEKTVVVRESALISQMVSRVELSLVRLYTTAAENPEFLGLGVVTDGGGTIVSGASLGEAESAIAELSDKTKVRAFITARNASLGLTHFTTATSTVEGKPLVWKPVSISGNDPMLGETIVALAGKTVARIAAGLVTALVPGAEEKSPQSIETDIAADALLPGSPIFDSEGSLLGLSTAVSRAASPSSFISASALLKKTENKPSP